MKRLKPPNHPDRERARARLRAPALRNAPTLDLVQPPLNRMKIPSWPISFIERITSARRNNKPS